MRSFLIAALLPLMAQAPARPDLIVTAEVTGQPVRFEFTGCKISVSSDGATLVVSVRGGAQ